MNYRIEHRMVGNNEYGHDEVIEIGDSILLKVNDCDAEELGLEPGEILEGAVFDFQDWRNWGVDSIMMRQDDKTFGFPVDKIEYIKKQ